jgi:hypothetical protein
VWLLHKALYHTALYKMVSMMKTGLLIGYDGCSVQKMAATAHHECLACALANTPKLSIPDGSGMRSPICGEIWSMDYQGPCRVQAIGGYTGRFTFIEISTGCGLVVLVKAKTLHSCTAQGAGFCRLHGKLM